MVAHPDGRDLANKGRKKTNSKEGEENGEKLGHCGRGSKVSESHRGYRHDAEIERIQKRPAFHQMVEDRPDGKKGKQQKTDGS